MDDISFYSRWLQAKFASVAGWLGENVFSWGMSIQLVLAAAAVLAAVLLSCRSAAWAEGRPKNGRRRRFIRIYAGYREIFLMAFAVVFLWLASLLMEGAELPHRFLRTAAILATAWAVIRFISGVIESPLRSRLIALSLWGLAALNIVGWLEPAVDLMDKAAISVGNIRISLLMLVKSVLAFAALMWAVGFLSRTLESSMTKLSGVTPSQRVLFYKLAMIALYAVAAVVGLNIVGLDLTALTVFSGALGLGVGFGLQKVFANLISGFILLLDKSVKPGDVIAIGNTYGWVNSLGARCVSVLTRDGKEHLIPNENLIAQEVENWSYSNRRVRVHIPIGVSYDSDVHLVRKLLLQAADGHPRILKEPQPACLLTGFGDNAVNFDLRGWIDDPDRGLANIRSEIYYRVWELFKEHGVGIPFPQRDVHLPPELLHFFQEWLKAQEERNAPDASPKPSL
jgi:small-conductance mechanosensitive channel